MDRTAMVKAMAPAMARVAAPNLRKNELEDPTGDSKVLEMSPWVTLKAAALDRNHMILGEE